VVLAVSLAWLGTRPPCPPNYVRLVDFGPALPGLAGLGLLVSGGALLLARKVGWHRTVAVVMCASTVLAVLLAATTLDQLVSDWGAQYGSGCWTF
jgi:type IV secretory pathway VirB2 component (pilin)